MSRERLPGNWLFFFGTERTSSLDLVDQTDTPSHILQKTASCYQCRYLSEERIIIKERGEERRGS